MRRRGIYLYYIFLFNTTNNLFGSYKDTITNESVGIEYSLTLNLETLILQL